MNNVFVIVTGNRYPNGDAGAIRQHSFAKILKSLGYRPLVISLGESTDFKWEKYDEIEYCSLRYSSENVLFRVIGRLLFAKNVMDIVNKLKEQICGFLLVSGGKRTFNAIKKFAIKNSINLYHDSVEWFSPCEFKNGARSAVYQQQLELNANVIDSHFKVIAISRYLENYFQRKSIKVVRIPVIMDTESISYEKNTDNTRIKIVYAGQVGGKDHIAEFVEAISLLPGSVQKKLQLCMIGITREAYESCFGRISSHLVKNDTVKFLGRISRDEVLKHLKSAHFTMLLRPENEIYAKAGFPTKVVESLSTGTPVICNFTSDLEMYLTSGVNCVVIDNCSIEACKEVLLKVSLMKIEDIEKMQRESRKTAEEKFDYKNYINLFEIFLENS